MARVVGVGGVFFKADDPKGLAAWYSRWLGLVIENDFIAAQFSPADQPPGGYTVWHPMRADTDYTAPSDKPFMINFMVDDLDEALAQVREGGAEVVGGQESYEFGRFGWFMDPEGNKIELWQPAVVP